MAHTLGRACCSTGARDSANARTAMQLRVQSPTGVHTVELASGARFSELRAAMALAADRRPVVSYVPTLNPDPDPNSQPEPEP